VGGSILMGGASILGGASGGAKSVCRGITCAVSWGDDGAGAAPTGAAVSQRIVAGDCSSTAGKGGAGSCPVAGNGSGNRGGSGARVRLWKNSASTRRSSGRRSATSAGRPAVISSSSDGTAGLSRGR
jgi:hypothetical protein